MNLQKKILFWLYSLLPCICIIAQTSVNSAGGIASGSGGSANYSIGQIDYQSNTGSNGSVTQGIQQVYEISIVNSIEEAIGINLSVLTYPNPTSDFLTLELDPSTLFSHQSLKYQLYDMHGKIIQNKTITNIKTTIDMSNLLPASYSLIIFKTEINTSKSIKTKRVASLKIIKNL